jgi:hypothetical protein
MLHHPPPKPVTMGLRRFTSLSSELFVMDNSYCSKPLAFFATKLQTLPACKNNKYLKKKKGS